MFRATLHNPHLPWALALPSVQPSPRHRQKQDLDFPHSIGDLHVGQRRRRPSWPASLPELGPKSDEENKNKVNVASSRGVRDEAGGGQLRFRKTLR